jgi:predicted GNAT family acetyltransferase
MRACLHAGATELLTVADPFLGADPFSANVIAVVAARVAADGTNSGQDRLWATVQGGDGRILGVAMHTPPRALFVSRMPDEAAVVLADALADRGRILPGVSGARDATTAFADRWAARTGHCSTVVTKMRMYRLRELGRPRDVTGHASLSSVSDDVVVVADWLAAFHQEATPHAPAEAWRQFAERRITSGEIHLWRDNGAPVSLAGVSAPGAGVARVGPVYTPAGFRRRGYGAAITAEASAAAIAGGARHVVLYTDLANPTSNAIYQSIGYEPDHDAEERTFD